MHTKFRTERVVSCVHCHHRNGNIFHSEVGRRVEVNLVEVLVSKHGQSHHSVELTKILALQKENESWLVLYCSTIMKLTKINIQSVFF